MNAYNSRTISGSSNVCTVWWELKQLPMGLVHTIPLPCIFRNGGGAGLHSAGSLSKRAIQSWQLDKNIFQPF